MEISKRLDYALCMLAESARTSEGEVVSVRSVAERNGIPYSFARTIQHELVKCGLLVTTRGPNGGMRLAVDPRTTTLLDIVEKVEGPLRLEGDERTLADTDEEAPSGYAPVWRELNTLLHQYLGSVTLWQMAIEGLTPVVPEDLRFELKYMA